MLNRVIKLGGSLLQLPDLTDRFHRWLAQQPRAANLVIVGGGELVDAIRKLDEMHRLDEARAHWLCVQAMSVTARLGAELLDLQLIEKMPTQAATEAACILDVQRFVERECARQNSPLPMSWDVTSDSIAARAAERMSAELVLLKSALSRVPDVGELAAAGYVDRYFPVAAARVLVTRLVNLRSEGFDEGSAIVGDQDSIDVTARGACLLRPPLRIE